MNLTEFQEKTHSIFSSMGEQELHQFLCQLVRKVPEGKREDFIALLVQNGKNLSSEVQNQMMQIKESEKNKLLEEFAHLKRQMEKISEGDICIQAWGYEDYSQGYWSADWVYEYEDSENVGGIYEDGCWLLQRCVNTGLYNMAEEIFNLLWEKEAFVDDQGDSFTLSLEELVREELASINLNALALHVWYAVYQASSKEERVQRLYEYLSIPIFKNISLEKLLQTGNEELVDFDAFLEDWIEFLSEKNGDTEQRMLKEALLMTHGTQGVLEMARRVSDTHPGLYLEALKIEERNFDYEKICKIGTEAMERIAAKYVVRSEIALLTAEAALRKGDEAFADECCWEAFVSNSTPVSYLRFMTESKNPVSYCAKISQILHSACKNKRNAYLSEELNENTISDMELAILTFLQGDFETTISKSLSNRQFLGWSGSFMKCGIALFLLLLLEDENLQQGGKEMLFEAMGYMGFQAETFCKGTKFSMINGNAEMAEIKEEQVFWETFRKWKAMQSLSNEQKERYMKILEKLIDGRIKAIVSGQHRNHYESVAALAAAFGEVKESIEKTPYKQIILEKYRKEFPRHSAFHAALRSYGMWK